MREWIKLGMAAMVVAGASGTAFAQSPPMPPSAIRADEATQLATGWTLITEGKHAEAAQLASQVLARNPRSVPALSLLIEADIARAGSTTALASYESWLGARTLEEPGVLRRIARAALQEWARQDKDVQARAEAFKALVAEGDPDALSVLTASAGAGAENDLRILAALGNEQAIDRLIGQLKTAQGMKLREIRVLGDSRNPRAAAALVAVLTDPLPQNRAAAADALGNLNRLDVVPHLKALLNDMHGQVRLSAAGALFRLGDRSGETLLRELAASESFAERRSAALLLSSQPDEAWKALVRGLAAAPDAPTRLDAAKLMIDHDPEFSRAVFEGLRADENLAIREEADLALSQSPLAGFAALRQYLRAGTGLVKVRAAARLLVFTR
ncbi:MAG TPA: HEAT repeat domain-containing protein [Vicinamibacterales bacterium]|jgi:HEAT repeat protein